MGKLKLDTLVKAATVFTSFVLTPATIGLTIWKTKKEEKMNSEPKKIVMTDEYGNVYHISSVKQSKKTTTAKTEEN